MNDVKFFPGIIITMALVFSLIGCTNKPTDENTEAAADATATTSDNQLSEKEIEEGWTLLFDGIDVDQWRGYNKDSFPDKGWSVEAGTLKILRSGTEEEGFGGDIITKEQFGNFELKLDFMVRDTSNSGIFYLAREIEDQPIYYNAPEYQILDNQTYIDMDIMDMDTHLTGDNYDLQAAPEDYTNPVGEWNTARIVVDHGHVEHWLNGKKTVEYQIGSPEWEAQVKASKFAEYPNYGRAEKGHIGLQDHGHEVRFKNIKIKPL